MVPMLASAILLLSYAPRYRSSEYYIQQASNVIFAPAPYAIEC